MIFDLESSAPQKKSPPSQENFIQHLIATLTYEHFPT